jgi:hypothetical protein
MKVQNAVFFSILKEKNLNLIKFLLNFFKNPKDVEKHLDLPPSWVLPIRITAKGLKRYFSSTEIQSEN